uniref:Uncharacterized protein n=1 Tax=Panagrolaimus sp. JU765 TaxID=591449 RepID=A0AC34RI78_9BILA
MHASRALVKADPHVLVSVPHVNSATSNVTNVGGTSISHNISSLGENNIEEAEMKYVHLISTAPQHQEESVSYTSTNITPIMASTSDGYHTPSQELYATTQLITGTASDGSIVEYLIGNTDFDGNNMYVEIMQDMNVIQENGDANLQQQLAINNSQMVVENSVYGNNIGNDVPVKKSRYARMSSEDRERYNARRRARRREKKFLEQSKIMNSDSENNIQQFLLSEEQQINLLQDYDIQAGTVISQDNLHQTTNVSCQYSDEQQYNVLNHLTPESEDQKMIIPTTMPNSTISSRSQDIVIRNARRAERARLRYQKLTPEERREYNMRRTLAKRAKKEAKNREESKNRAEHLESFAVSINGNDGTSNISEEALSKLEKDVVRRTIAAQMLLKQKEDRQFIDQASSSSSYNSIDETIEHVAAYGPTMPLDEDQMNFPQIQEYVEPPSAFPLMFVDQNGNPASLPEGTVIEVRQDHPNGPQTIIIHTTTPFQVPPDNARYVPSSNEMSVDQDLMVQGDYSSSSTPQPSGKKDVSSTPKSEAARLRRAERARQRYHNMTEEVRREFNAKRSVALRRSRLRDEQLCRLNEDAKKEGRILDPETQKAVDDALARRAKRAESARLKYQRMTPEERRAYNANRDAVRKARKRSSESRLRTPETPDSVVIVVDDDFKYVQN